MVKRIIEVEKPILEDVIAIRELYQVSPDNDVLFDTQDCVYEALLRAGNTPYEVVQKKEIYINAARLIIYSES